MSSEPYLTSEQWAHFVDTQQKAFETFGKETIDFFTLDFNMDLFQEDGDASLGPYIKYSGLEVIINYNYYRVWGVNTNKDSGEKPGQSIVAIFNPNQLATILPSSHYDPLKKQFIFDSNSDFFVHRGVRYTPQGDTFLSQENANPLWVMVVLQVDYRKTGIPKTKNEEGHVY